MKRSEAAKEEVMSLRLLRIPDICTAILQLQTISGIMILLGEF
jgi:hypothetical protein